MINDHTDAEIARREHDYEMGGETASERAWSRFVDDCEEELFKRGYGTSLDGNEATDGYSLDTAHEAFRLGHTVEEYMETVDADRHDLGLLGYLAAREPRSMAEAKFNKDFPLKLTRSDYQAPDKCIYIYSEAVDGFNRLRVATINLANVTGLNDDQVKYLTERVANAIVGAKL